MLYRAVNGIFSLLWLFGCSRVITGGYEHVEGSSVQLGVHVAETYTSYEYHHRLKEAAKLRAEIVRVPVDWAALEPIRDSFDLSYMREVNQRFEWAAELGLKCILMFAQSPEWASGNPDPAFPPLPVHVPDYAMALKELYDSLSPVARASIVAVEVWNEPNSIEFWPRYPSPRPGTYVLVPLEAAEEYAYLLSETYRTLKTYYPSITVLGGSLASADVDYLTALFGSLDTLGSPSMDALALHPYTRVDEYSESNYGWAQYPDQCNEEDPLSPPWCFKEGIEIVRDFLNSHGHGDMEIWLTEFGVSSGNNWGDAGSEYKQNNHLRIYLETLENYSSLWNVPVAVWYRLRDDGDDLFGLLRESGSYKPVARTFRGFKEYPDEPLP